MATKSAAESVRSEHRNEVLLVGRLAASPELRELPSGTPLVTFRLIVDRPPVAAARAAPPPPARPTVDTLDCASYASVVHRSCASWSPGDVLEVTGALRRRFWRAPTGAASRYEVEVSKARRLRRR